MFPVSCPQGLRANSLNMTPTNIITSKAILANVTTPVVVFNGLFDFIRLKNLGNGGKNLLIAYFMWYIITVHVVT